MGSYPTFEDTASPAVLHVCVFYPLFEVSRAQAVSLQCQGTSDTIEHFYRTNRRAPVASNSIISNNRTQSTHNIRQ